MDAAGWKSGTPLIGSKDVPDNEFLRHFLSDGELSAKAATSMLTGRPLICV